MVRLFKTVHSSRYIVCAGVFNYLALACAWVNGSSTAMIYMKRLCLFVERLFNTVHSSRYMNCAGVLNLLALAYAWVNGSSTAMI